MWPGQCANPDISHGVTTEETSVGLRLVGKKWKEDWGKKGEGREVKSGQVK